MKTLQFKSNIKCTGCMAKVGPLLDQHTGIEKWDVNIFTPEKTLTVETADLTAEDVQQIVHQAGFVAEPLNQ